MIKSFKFNNKNNNTQKIKSNKINKTKNKNAKKRRKAS